jgi:hypothetical protein
MLGSVNSRIFFQGRGLQQAVFVVGKSKDGWRVELPDGTQLGPYLATIALQVATTHVLLARKQGMATRVAVRDAYGRGHDCRIVERLADKQPCPHCEASAPAAAALAAGCQFYADINGR